MASSNRKTARLAIEERVTPVNERALMASPGGDPLGAAQRTGGAVMAGRYGRHLGAAVAELPALDDRVFAL